MVNYTDRMVSYNAKPIGVIVCLFNERSYKNPMRLEIYPGSSLWHGQM
jgi:hypothetical protein